MRTQCRVGRKHRSCLPSLDEIAGGLCVDITKINWILVISSKCDTVVPSYEPGSAATTTTTLLSSERASASTILCN